MLKKNIIASIVTFNPDIERLSLNINAICNQVEKIIVIDNGSHNIKSVKDTFENLVNKKLEFIVNNENKGIAYALNQALEYSINEGYEWLLTLDQDSVCDEKIIHEFKKFIKTNKQINEVGILGPKIIDNNINYSNEIRKECYIEEVDTVITSGSLINTEIAKKIGGFVDELFIDGVDFEFCLNVRLKGYKIYKVNNAKLYHELGKIKEHNILGIKLITTNHSAVRRYYYFRNKVYIYRKYFKIFPKWVIRNILSSIKTGFLIVLFEEDKSSKINKSFRGINDGISSKFGRLEE